MENELIYTREEVQQYLDRPVSIKQGDALLGYGKIDFQGDFLWNVTTSEEEFIDALTGNIDRSTIKEVWEEPFYSMFFIKPLRDMPLHINDETVSHIAKWRLDIGK